MDVALEFSVSNLETMIQALRDGGKDCGITLQHLCWEVAADAAKDMVKYSPPMSMGTKQNKAGKTIGVVEGWGKAQNAGQGAIYSDMDRVFAITDAPDRLFWEFNGKYYTRKTNERTVGEIDAGHVTHSVGTVANIHRAHQDRRGRTHKPGLQYWAMRRHFWAYEKRLEGHVGKLKAGWLPAVRRYCAKVGKSFKFPGWIERHNTPCLISDTVSETGDGKIVIENGAPHAHAIRKDMVSYVMKKRQADIDTFLEKRVEKIAQRISEAGA